MATLPLYVPALQSVHVASARRLYLPAGHTTAVGVVLPEGHANPGVHGPVQLAVVKPLTAPYRPGSQGPEQAAVGRPAVAPYLPGGHRVQTPAPARE